MTSDAGDTRGPARAAGGSARARAEFDPRARLDAELATLLPLNSSELRALARVESPPDGVARLSAGTLVALLRRAAAGGDLKLAQELFVSLLERTEACNRRWAARVVAHTPSLRSMVQGRASVREDLKQELTLHLWQRLARERDPAWELFFARALAFAQRRVARSYMERNGYWAASGASQHPERLPALMLSQLATYDEGDAVPAEERLAAREPSAEEQSLTLADLADLRELVGRLPARERLAVVMRFWLGAREREIAAALGVTTRTVRNLLGRAYARLRRDYTGTTDDDTDDGESDAAAWAGWDTADARGAG